MGTLKINKKVANTGSVSTEANVAKRTVNKAEKQVAPEVNVESIELCELAGRDDGFVEELKNLRTSNETVYRRNDRTCRKIITASPTRYIDTDGEYKQISNKLTDNGAEIVNETNSFKVKFDKSVHNGKIFDLQRGNKKITLSAASTKKSRGHVCGCKCELCAGKDNSVTATFDDGTEIEYVTLNDRVKENIIVKERQANYEYNFTLNIGDMTVEEGEHNALLLKDKETGETEFSIPAPYMYDANGVRSNKVTYEIDVNGEELEIKVIADAEFINAEERALPVIIDPQITVVYGQAFSYLTIADSITNTELDEYKGEISVYEEKAQSLSKFVRFSINKVDINVNGVIEKVELVIAAKPGAKGYFEVQGEVLALEEKTYAIDITNLYTNGGNAFIFEIYGKVFKYNNDRSEADFYSAGEENEAKLLITYIETSDKDEGEGDDNQENDNIENFSNNRPNIKTFKLGEKASAHIDLNSADLTTEVIDFNVGNMVPVKISHIHKLGKDDEGFGENWRLNLVNRTLKSYKSAADSVKKYSYKDELGNYYTFSEKFYYYKEGKRIAVEKSKVAVDINGELWFEGNRVYVQQICNDYTLIARIEDYVGSEFLEQRQNEHIQLEDAVKSYEQYIRSLVVLDLSETETQGLIVKKISGTEKADFEKLQEEAAKRSYYLIMTESEAIQMQSTLSNIKQINLQSKKIANEINAYEAEIAHYDAEIQVFEQRIASSSESLLSKEQAERDKQKTLIYRNLAVKNKEVAEKQLLMTYDQRDNITAQKNYAVSQFRENTATLIDYFNTYHKKRNELEQYERNMPINYLRDKCGEISGFNEDGRLVCIMDGYGNAASMEYNTDGQLTRIYEGETITADFRYVDGKLNTVTDNRGRTVTYEYKGTKLQGITYGDGETYEIKYSNGPIGSITAGKSRQWKMGYTSGKINSLTEKSILPVSATVSETVIKYFTDRTKITYSDGNNEIFTFDSAKNLINHSKTDGAKFCTEVKYAYEKNETGKKVTEETRKDPDTDRAEVNIRQYDDIELLVTEIAEWQNVSETVKEKTETAYEYDMRGKLKGETSTKFTDESGTVKQTVYITKYSYNAQGSLVLTESYIEGEEKISGINYEQRVYNDSGNMVKCIRWNSLDSSSKFYEESDRAENGQVTADRDETGEISAEYGYIDGTNVVNTVKYPNGSKFAYGRNPNNDVVTAITQSTDEGEANATNIVYEYDLPVSVESGNTVIDYTYDGKGRKKTVTVNGVLQSEYSYEDYDGKNLNAVRFAKKSHTLRDGTKSYKSVYLKEGAWNNDENCLIVNESLKIGSYSLYNKHYNFKGELESLSYDNDAVKVTYTYDNYDNVTNISGGGLTETYTYNAYGELTQKTLTGAVTQTYSYAYKNNAARSLDYITFGNYKFKPLTDVNGRNAGREIYSGNNKVAGEYITYRKVGDHATNMPATVWFGNGEKIADSIKYKYDWCGNICEIRENGHVVAKYTYDSLNRLIREDNKAIGTTTLFTYDNAGNITERCVYDYTSKSGEELEEIDCKHFSYDYEGDKLVNCNGETFAYNNLGNPTIYSGKACEWQYGTRLTKFGNTTFAYNGLGRRTSKGSTTFTYDNDGRLIKQTDGTDVLEFIYDNSGLAGLKRNGTQYFYRKDAQGNVIAILNVGGAVVVKYVYDAWGNHAITDIDGNDIESGIGALNPFRYRGYYYDTETGLYYLQTRYYDPEVGRFISQDSIEYADPETINGLNLYAYCNNNPVMNVDPTGEFALTAFFVALIIGAGVGAAVGGTISGVKAYKDGRRGLELFASIASGAIIGGAMGAVLTIGGAAGLAATGATVAGFGLTTLQALGASALIGSFANLSSYLVVNGIHKDKHITWGGAFNSIGNGAFQAIATFFAGFIGGKNGLFNNLGNFKTWNGFYINQLNATGKLNLLTRIFYGTSMLFGDTITRALYLSGSAAGIRTLINYIFYKIPN